MIILCQHLLNSNSTKFITNKRTALTIKCSTVSKVLIAVISGSGLLKFTGILLLTDLRHSRDQDICKDEQRKEEYA